MAEPDRDRVAREAPGGTMPSPGEAAPRAASRPRRGALWAERSALALLVVSGAVARFVALGILPLGAPETEEGTSWLATAGQMAHGYPLLPSGFIYWKGWPYTIAASLASHLFGLSNFSLRLPAALAGTAAIWLAWWATRRALRQLEVSESIGAVASLLAAYGVSASAWAVLMSRSARFYAPGQALFLAAAGAALPALARDNEGRRGWLLAFGALAFASATTFHAGGLVLFALPAAALLGARPRRGQIPVVAATLLLTAAWYLGALFVWRTGHVEAPRGEGDAAAFFGGSFPRTLAILLPALWAWWEIARAGERRPGAARADAAPATSAARETLAAAGSTSPPRPAIGPGESRVRRRALPTAIALTVLVLEVLLVALPVATIRSPLRSFRILAASHAGFMGAVALGLLALALAAPAMRRVARRTAGLVWILAFVPAALVGGSGGHFVPRYLYFATGPLLIAAMAGLAILCERAPIPVRRWSPLLLAVAVPLALLPEVGPVAMARAARVAAGDPIPDLLAASPSRPYAMDVEGPSRLVAASLRPGDLVIGTNRSIPHAVIGRMDYWFSPVLASMAYRTPEGAPRSLLTGCPILTRPEELAALCASRRVWLIVDPQSRSAAEVGELESWLGERGISAVEPAAPARAALYRIDPGCVPSS